MSTLEPVRTRRALVAYFILLAALCAAVVIGTRLLGRQGAYLAQVYMLTPALAALVTRTFFYEFRFRDAGLKIGPVKDYFRYWLASLGIVALFFIGHTIIGAVKWDLSGNVFLERLAQQFAAAGQDMEASLPAGFTPKTMLLVYFIGGLTVFNVLPGLISGLGEELGHRGLMFPLLYRINPRSALLICGLIWYAWHLPLLLIVPQGSSVMTSWQATLNHVILAFGAICTFLYLAYVYVRSGSIFVTAIAHITMNNASMSLSYFSIVQKQLTANLITSLVMLLVAATLLISGRLRVFETILGRPAPIADAA